MFHTLAYQFALLFVVEVIPLGKHDGTLAKGGATLHRANEQSDKSKVIPLHRANE